MPVEEIEVAPSIPRIRILGPEGEVDEALDPKIPDDDLRELYRTMLLARAYDERRLTLQRQGRIGTFAPVTGQEAAQLGSVYAIRESDWVVPSFREMAVGLWRGLRLEDDLAYCAGLEEGVNLPEGSRDLPIAIPVGSQVVHAAGLGWARRLLGTGEVVLCYFGDGATSEGDFHEGLNFAQLFNAPVVFVCQNNQYAISVPRSRQTRSATLAQKAVAYGMRAAIADGNDLLAVYRATRDAVERARRGEGPALIELVTYRLSVHTTADDPTKYRSPEELAEWEKRDPLPRLRAYLQRRGLVADDEEARWNDENAARISDAVRRFEARPPPDPLAMFDHILSEPTLEMRRQRDALARALEDREPAPAPHAEPEPAVQEQRSGAGIGVPDRERVGSGARVEQVEE